MHSKKYRIVQLFIFLISILIFFVHAQAKEIILDCIDVKEIQCIALELKQINKCSLLFSADARSKFDLKDVPSEEMITIRNGCFIDDIQCFFYWFSCRNGCA